MGFLRRDPDPLILKLVATLLAQNKSQQEFTERVMGMISEQQQLTQRFMQQYISSGQNTKSSLDDRLYAKELEVSAPEWEAMPNPFDGM